MNIELKKNVYIELLDTLNAGKKAVMTTVFNSSGSEKGSLPVMTLLREEDFKDHKSANLDSFLFEKAQYSLETGNQQFVDSPDTGTVLFEPYFPEPQLIVLGGGHISKPLVEFAAKVGFKVTVADDRPLFANAERFPYAEKVICESFENCFSLLNLNESSFVVIVTRGHRHDMFCLKETLNYDTAYVGMIGSRRRIKIVFEQLLSEGCPQEKLKKVNAPIGLEIDAVTPEEIAISILAQVISFRRKKKAISGTLATKINWPELDRNVIGELAKELRTPKAVVSIISTKGSVPRKTGAKMIVFPDGRTLGSIGGGCSEGEVINAAYDVIKNRGYMFKTVDMTGYVAEEEGMVCGGLMDVVIMYNDF